MRVVPGTALPSLIALALACASSAVHANRPAAGSFGFDWLRPKSARCEAVSEALLKRFRRCEHRAGAFGLSDPVHLCRVDGRSEYLVFASKAACIENLETMKANGP
jgi:hypothetical protein